MKKKKGFTLVELLAVIAILAIILLIAVPTILGVIDQSKQDAFKDSTLSIFKAAEMKAVTEGKYSGNVSELSLSNNKFLTGKWTYNKDDNTIVLTQVCDGNYKVDVVVSNNANMTLNKDNGTCGFEIAIEGNNPDTVSCHASNEYIDQGASYGNNKITSLDKVDLRYAGNYTLNYLYGSFKASRLVRVTNTNQPSIELSTNKVDVYVGDSFNASNYLTSALDLCEGDIKAQVISESTVIMDIPGEYNVTYKVTNKGGVEEVKTLTVVVKALETPRIVLPSVDGSNGWYKSSQTITVNYNKEVLNSYDYAISTDGGANYSAWTNTTANTFVLNENSGNIKVKVRGKRGSGYTIPTESTVLKMDTTIPSITAKSASNEVIVRQSKSVYDYFTINQDLGISGGTKECKVGSTTLTNTNTLASGTHNITCTITTTSGRTSNAVTSLTVYNDTYVFDYTGGSQTFNVPVNGTYKVELWGARGGNFINVAAGDVRPNGYFGGNGAYTKGNIAFNKGENLYIYVGGRGPDGDSDAGGYNGGGSLLGGQYRYGRAGGGATDIRTVPGTWNDFFSLKARIMVASAGGGANNRNYIETYTSYYGAGNGGAGGGITGERGEAINYIQSSGLTYGRYGYGTGGGQINGGYNINIDSKTQVQITKFLSGLFGMSNIEVEEGVSQSGSGAGYYNGGSSLHGGAGGGSSFISGHSGCNAIAASSTAASITHTNQPNHYSGKVFTNTQMIAGNQTMINPRSGSQTTGNADHGYAKITLLSIN